MSDISSIEFEEQLKGRTKQFAIRMIKLFQALPKTKEAGVLGEQLLRSATAVAARYRAACRASSEAAFTAAMGTVVEEADETVSWLELLEESGIIAPERLTLLGKEAHEIAAIVTNLHSRPRTKD